MLDRQKGDIVFECDACSEVLETSTSNFESALSVLRRSGWKAHKSGEEWKHLCHACVKPT